MTRVNPDTICVAAGGYHEAMTATSEVDLPDNSTIRNPATGAVAGTVRWTDPADVPRIAAGLREAQKQWEARGAKGRAKVLARYAVWMGEHRDEKRREDHGNAARQRRPVGPADPVVGEPATAGCCNECGELEARPRVCSRRARDEEH